MRVFISWSGQRSNLLAKALRDWLPAVVQAVRPYFSTDDIQKGARWNADVARELQEAKVGLICVTSENLSAPWLMFEAGALAKSLEGTCVIPVLLDIESSALVGPLAQFQTARLDSTDMRRVVRTINQQLATAGLQDSVLSSVFDKWWPDLETRVTEIRLQRAATETPPVRSEREMLEEVLAHVRDLNLRRTERKPGFEDLSRMLVASIGELDLTTRVENCLRAENIQTIRDLLTYSETDLLKTQNLGRKGLNEIKEVLASRGMVLKNDLRGDA